MGRLEGRSHLEDLRDGFWDNIKMNLKGGLWGSMNCIALAQDRDRFRALVNAVMNFRVAQNSGNYSCCFLKFQNYILWYLERLVETSCCVRLRESYNKFRRCWIK